MLLELAIGDAYVAAHSATGNMTVERGSSWAQSRPLNISALDPFFYTDYTQMNVAIAELVISEPSWTLETITGHFFDVVKRDPREGDAKKFYRFLKSMGQSHCLTDIFSRNDKNRVAMRTVPIGVLSDIQSIVNYVEMQIAITENAVGINDAAIAIALMTHYFLYNLGGRTSLGQYMRSSLPRLGQGCANSKSSMSVHATIAALERNTSLYALFKDCLTYMSDLEAVPMIALAVGSCSPEIEQDLPNSLVSNLENGPYGRDYLMRLDRDLMSRVKR